MRVAARTDPARLVELLSDRSLHDIAQLIGEAVLRALDANIPAAHELATRLVKTLNARRWAGDDELSTAVNSALGVGPAPTLPTARVDLEELSAALEDGRGEGGRLNVTNGLLWHGDPSYYSDDELPDFESDDWLFVGSLGSRESYRDMEIFISSLTDADLAAQLDRAITGRGAFRRFKDVLFDRPDERFAYYLLTNERKRGRAREWLAFVGYRVALEPPE
ncbi:UPF0158 family protein [Gordonia asplenii]|nr:UPF0158 family protein [Gordonia asplenii]